MDASDLNVLFIPEHSASFKVEMGVVSYEGQVHAPAAKVAITQPVTEQEWTCEVTYYNVETQTAVVRIVKVK